MFRLACQFGEENAARWMRTPQTQTDKALKRNDFPQPGCLLHGRHYCVITGTASLLFSNCGGREFIGRVHI
jgi:hypothetical protein